MAYVEYESDGKTIKARVIQKVDTLANWNANNLILLKGEQAIVVDANGIPYNTKFGDGTKKFSELDFWIKYDQGQFISLGTSKVLPTPENDVAYTLASPGTYTRAGQANIVVTANMLGMLSWNGSAWSINDTITIPSGQNGNQLAPDWTTADVGLTYPTTRVDDGKFYRVISGQTAGATDRPSLTPGKWEMIGDQVDKAKELSAVSVNYNHLNPETAVAGRLDAITGKPTGLTWKTSDFIAWQDFTKFYFGFINESNGNAGSNLVDICQYDATFNYLGSKVNAAQSSKASGAAYVRISTTSVLPIVSHIPLINVPPYEYYKPKANFIGRNKAVFESGIIQNVALEHSDNLVGVADYIPNAIFDKTLSGIRYNSAYVTGVIRIKVKPNTVYSRDKNTIFGANYNSVGFFKDKDTPSDFTLFADTLTFTTPSDTQYIVLTGTKVNNITVVEGAVIKTIEPTVRLKSKDGFNVAPYFQTTPGKNIFDKDTMLIEGKIVDYASKTLVNSATGQTAIIPVTGSVRYVRNSKNTNVAELYQGVLELTSYNFQTGEYTTNLGYNLDSFVVSSNAKYIAVTVKNGTESIANSLQVEQGDVSTDYESFERRAVVNEKFPAFVNQDLIDAIIKHLPNNNIDTDMKELKKIPSNYGVLLDDAAFRIYSPIRKNSDTSPDIFPKIVALGGNIAIYAFNSYTLEISTSGIDGLKYINNGTNPNRITLSNTTLKGTTNANFQSIHVLPYKRGNVLAEGATNDYRVVIITKGGEIYHNKPQRSIDGSDLPLAGDHLVFDQSVVWDMPHRRLPHISNTAFPYYKNPAVPEPAYFPVLNTDGAFVDSFGNGGFGISKTEGSVQRVRFLIRFNGIDMNPFRTMGGVIVEPQNMWIATYNPSWSSTTQVTRECVFHTVNGREWYNVYEFIPSNLLGTRLNTSGLPAYNANTLAIVNRDMDFPKEGYTPTTLFKPAAKVNISSITIGSNAVITTTEPHGLELPQGIIAIQTASGATVQSEYSWMLNDAVTPNDYGNNVFFAYKRLTNTTFEIHEYINANTNNLQSRHIHCLNRAKDGVTIGTGEEYYTRQVSERSTTTLEGWYPQTHYIHLSAPAYVATKLNSSENGVLRPLGFILMDDKDQHMLSASDSDIAGKTVPTANGTLYRGATGLFKGKLIDINDRSKFETILESPDVSFFFQKVRDIYIYADVKGFIAVSTDLVNWSTTYLNSTVFKLGGVDDLNRVCVDGIIIYKK